MRLGGEKGEVVCGCCRNVRRLDDDGDGGGGGGVTGGGAAVELRISSGQYHVVSAGFWKGVCGGACVVLLKMKDS